ncbi:4'-phosphopantetheinyl transferase superfamily protein [Limosilactobacillus reuteri]|uniref:4'-phosphopantetheinyl transferase family protein n=1 Tax=Limosilactobacillus reuteri TaxID=1598 RepID=UPI001E559DA5|nr:4'-phosphopantetheinyl transferase superfamily protein [Limosilactobacillus reuteri]MCC4411293.1 4'-phosphopantetheinyl transferase superfamily protein [Limosilactobacillus reuteri]
MIIIIKKKFNIREYQVQLKFFKQMYHDKKISIKDFNRILNIKNKYHRLQSILARNLLISYFDSKKISDYKLTSSLKNVPLVIGADNPIFISISHSKNLITVAIANRRIGIDTEYILKPFPSILRSKWNSQNYIYPYRTWTSIESYLKYLGIGLTKDLTTINIAFKNTNQNIVIDKGTKKVFSSVTLKEKDYLITVTQKNYFSMDDIKTITYA